MTRRRLLATGTVAYLVALLLTLPAERVRGPLESTLPGVQLGSLHGHPLYGHAEGSRIGDLALDSLAWRWRPLSLLGGRLEFAVQVTAATLRTQFDVSRALGGHAPALNGLRGELDLTSLGTMLPGLPVRLEGRLQVDDATFSLDAEGWPRAGSGHLTLQDGALNSPARLRIGAVEATLEIVDGRLEIPFSLSPDGPLAGEGQFILSSDRAYDLSARLAPGRDPDVKTSEWLQLAGAAQADGRVHVRLKGRMR